MFVFCPFHFVRFCWLSVPIWLRIIFSAIFLSVSQRNSLPEHAPIPGSSSKTILSSALGFDGVSLAMDGVDQRHRAHRSDKVGMGKKRFVHTRHMGEEEGGEGKTRDMDGNTSMEGVIHTKTNGDTVEGKTDGMKG